MHDPRRRRLTEVLAAGLATILSVAAFNACSSGQIRDFVLRPPTGQGPFPEVIVNGVRVGAEYLDDTSLREYLQREGRENLNQGIRETNTVPFLISVRNGTESDVVFDPRGTHLAGSGNVVLKPLDYTDVYMRLKRGRARQGILQGLKDIVLSSPVSLDPGDKVEGFLLFARPEAVKTEVTLALDGIYIDGEPTEAKLSFEAVAREGN
ncbi:MAG: hypothetical protein JSV26_09660 [bacterium]|nr:MAG: hypothetical protein JSV26_09660 [bacterium]